MLKKKSLVLGFMLIMLLAMSGSLMAETYTVTSITDTGSETTTEGKLSWAVTQSNASTEDGDNIVFILSSGSTLVISGALPTITDGVTIDGDDEGTHVTVQVTTPGTSTWRVFYIDASGETINFSNMTIKGGDISGYGDVWAACGGGIFFEAGTLNLHTVTISGSKAFHGGGLLNRNTSPTLTNCTISGNSAEVCGGGMYNDGYDGTSSPTLTNCTISGNSAAFGGGIYGYDSGLYIKNTILANNTATTSGLDFYKNDGTVFDNGYNVVENCYNYAFITTGDIAGEQADLWGTGISATPSLADNNTLNGTQTLKTKDGSVAINAGTSDQDGHPVVIPTTDQRGAGRNSTTDIGAYEWWDDAGSLPVTLSTFTAQFLENTPTLYWTTQSETDNMGWFVYRGEENSFTTSEKISEFIEGHGTTTLQQSYIYEDRIQNPEVGDKYYYWLESIEYSGIINHYDKVAVLTIPDQHDPGGGLIPEPVRYGLFQNEPNPVISSTKISFNLPETAQVELAIYNLKGQLVKSLYSGVTSSKTLDWNGKDENGNELQAGVYLYKLLVNGKTAETKKLILMK